MAKSRWSDSFSVGVPVLDSQHQQFFEILSCLEDAIERGEEEAILEDLLKSLVDYLQYHFQAEEDYLQSHFHPTLDLQRSEHNYFTLTVAKMMRGFRSGKKGLPKDLHDFLFEWMSGHIVKCDMKYSIKEKRVSRGLL